MPFWFKRKEDLPKDIDNQIELVEELSLMDERRIPFCEMKFSPPIPIQLKKMDINSVIEHIKKYTGSYIMTTNLPRMTKDEFELLVSRVCRKK